VIVRGLVSLNKGVAWNARVSGIQGDHLKAIIDKPTLKGSVTMNSVTKTILIALLAFGLAACKSKEPAPEPTPEPEVQQPAPEPVDVNAYKGPGDLQHPDALKDPRNILSKRVIYFDYDKSDIKGEYREILNAHATFMRANPNARVTLEGHADERGTREYNLGLGERRGNAVTDYVDAAGASGGQLSVVSYGEERPVANCSNESCWSQNRRVEIVYTRVQ
jgi:peptidoglycan-associated lipoprotein